MNFNLKIILFNIYLFNYYVILIFKQVYFYNNIKNFNLQNNYISYIYILEKNLTM